MDAYEGRVDFHLHDPELIPIGLLFRWARKIILSFSAPRLLIVLSIAVLFILSAASLNAAYLRNVPQTIIQPDGTVINCLASGDEFYNWLHDADDYTIIQDPYTGYYVYALKNLMGELLPSSFMVGRYDPKALNLEKGVRLSAVQRRERREARFEGIPKAPAPHYGTLNNIVIFIRFSDDSEFTNNISTYNTNFNGPATGNGSLHQYYQEASYSSISINTNFYPDRTGATVISYQDGQPWNYYRPYNAVTNPIGYSNGTELRTREHTLLKNAINSCSSQIVADDLNLDGDGDGNVDNVCFIVKGSPDGWNDLLWPHMWSLYTYSVYIGTKRVYTYNFQLNQTSGPGPSVLCHEMGHSLGAPDLYRYYDTTIEPVGFYDLMAYNLAQPQHMGAYMKYKYMGWITPLPTITTSGWYTLNPLTSSTGNCFKIASPASATEFFVVEFRRKTGYDTMMCNSYGEGLLVYRINTSTAGNANGPPDEIYIYREDGTLTVNGKYTDAMFSSEKGRVMITDATNPSSFLSTTGLGGLNIYSIGSSAGSTMSFYINIGPPITVPTVTTTAASSITATSALSGGIVTSDGGAAVTARGVCVSTSANPTTANNHTHDGTGTGAFTSSLTSAAPLTTYHVRAYATNSVGTGYGSDLTFTTLAPIPTVTTTVISSLTKTSLVTGGNVMSDGGAAVTERGVCVATSANPTTANNHTHDGAGTGAFTSSLTSATPGMTYHVRAYATNSWGTSYGNDLWFRMLGATKSDFNGDGQEDLLWRNFNSGENYLWYLGYSAAGTAGLQTADSQGMFQGPGSAKIIGDAGIPFSGKPVTIYRSFREGGRPGQTVRTPKEGLKAPGQGQSALTFIRPFEGLVTTFGLTRSGGASLPPLTDLNWKIAGTGDFNGDGKTDILWWNAVTGEIGVWYMNGGTRIGAEYLPTMTDMNWQIVGTGDFNGDGKPDIVWRNLATGDNGIWYMSGATRLGAEYLLTVTDMTWQIVGTGDFNGDGKADIVWRNAVSGENYIWCMDGTTRIGGIQPPSVTDTTWQIVATGDYNQDGMFDIVWRNTVSGENAAWYMNGATRIGMEFLLTVADLSWRIVNR